MEAEETRKTVKKTNWLGGIVIVVLGLAVLAIIGGVIFRIGWCTFVDKHETCFVYNRFTGDIEIPDRTGYIVRGPIKYSVHTIDMRPYQLSITADIVSGAGKSSGISSRVLNAKLVRFNPAGIQTFVSWHGRSAGDNLANLLEIMKCYAFDKEGGKDCPFIIVLNEINPSQTPSMSNMSGVRP